MFDDLVHVQSLILLLTDEASILQLKEEDGVKNSSLGPFQFNTKGSSRGILSGNNKSILSVNTNGIKKNGHPLIQHTLSKYAICCVQETHFATVTPWSLFSFTRLPHSDIFFLSVTRVVFTLIPFGNE